MIKKIKRIEKLLVFLDDEETVDDLLKQLEDARQDVLNGFSGAFSSMVDNLLDNDEMIEFGEMTLDKELSDQVGKTAFIKRA